MILARPSAAGLLAAMDGWTAPPRTPAKWIDADGTDIRPSRGAQDARGAEARTGPGRARRPAGAGLRKKVELAPPRYGPPIRIMEALGPIRSGRYG